MRDSGGETRGGSRQDRTFENCSKPSHPAGTVLLVVLVFTLALSIFYLANKQQTSGFRLPPGNRSTDPARYVNLGWSLAQGQGLSLNYGDPELRKTYEDWNQDHDFDYLLARSYRGTSTFTPPGYPVLLAGLFSVVGLQPGAARWLSAGLMAGACCLAFLLAKRRGGWVAALVTLGLCLDGRVQYYASEAHAEALATFLVMLLFYLWERIPKGTARPVLLGVLTGVLVLVRSNYLLWLPFVGLALVYSLKGQSSDIRTQRGKKAGLFLASLLVLVAPWLLRNCLVTKSFEPLPTNGRIGLVGAYCDGSYQNWGCFSSGTLWKSSRELVEEENLHQASVATRERAAAQRGQRLALQWLREHWQKVPTLMMMRCLNHFQLYPWRSNRFFSYPARMVVWFLFLASLATAAAGSLEATVGKMLVVDAVVVAFTWAIEGRFLVPLLPLIYLVIGLGFARLVQRMRGTRYEGQ